MSWLRNLLARFGFGKRFPQMTVEEGRGFCEGIDARLVAAREQMYLNARNARLAQIARQRSALKDKLAKAKEQKKARKWIYEALEALTTEELRLESGR